VIKPRSGIPSIFQSPNEDLSLYKIKIKPRRVVERLRQFLYNEKQTQGEEILEDKNETTPLTSKLTNDRYQDSSVNANC
jgi:hypothetical protein